MRGRCGRVVRACQTCRVSSTDVHPQSRGRSTRGQHRREALIAAATSLLVERGITAISHRAVAARAELPLAATTYYFASLADLTQEALQRVTDSWRNTAQGLVDRTPARLTPREVAAAVLEIATARPAQASASHAGGVMAMYERYLEAGRHERLRPIVHAYNEELLRLVQEVLARGELPADRKTAQLALAVVDGGSIYAVAEGVAPAASATDLLSDLLVLLRHS
ncbi:MAG: hypothetical protein JWN55_2553 [Frankiales bacterium]|nr:hypothetical protein [Frankiales bacterium]